MMLRQWLRRAASSSTFASVASPVSASAGTSARAAPPQVSQIQVGLPPLVALHRVRRAVANAPPGVPAHAHAAASAIWAGAEDLADAVRRGGKRARENAGMSSEAESQRKTSSLASVSDSDGSHTAAESNSALVAAPVSQDSNASAGAAVKLPRLRGAALRLSRAAPLATPPAVAGADPALVEAAPELTARLFAVVNLGATQYKVTAGDVICAERLPSAVVGSVLRLSDVALVGSRERTLVGRPLVPGAAVRVAVEEQARDRKVIVFKKRRRKRYQKTQGHRRHVTRLRVLDVELPPGGLEAF